MSKYKLIPNDDTKSDGPAVRTGFTGERGRGGPGGGGGGLLSTNTEEELIQLKLKIVLSFSSHLNNNYSKVVLRRFSLGRLEGRRKEKDKHFSLRSDDLGKPSVVLLQHKSHPADVKSNVRKQKIIYTKNFQPATRGG